MSFYCFHFGGKKLSNCALFRVSLSSGNIVHIVSKAHWLVHLSDTLIPLIKYCI